MSGTALVYTIGHSTRTLRELGELLGRFEVRVLADTRSIPRSRHNPQFNPEELEPHLASLGIEYRHIMSPGRDAYPHRLSEGLRVHDGAITYPGSQAELPWEGPST